MINSYGYRVMSLEEVVRELGAHCLQLGQQPVWVRTRDLYRPVRAVELTSSGRVILDIVRD